MVEESQGRGTGERGDIPEMPAPRVHERRAAGMPGLPFLLIALLVVAAGIALIATGAGRKGGTEAVLIAAGVLVVLAAFITLFGLTQVAPGQARVFQLFGRYRAPSARTACAG